MKSKKGLFVILGILAAVGAVIFFIVKKKSAAAAADIPTGNPGTVTPPVSGPGPRSLGLVNLTFPIKRGDKGRQVLNVQVYLVAGAGESLTLDGIFGPATQAAWQRATGKTEICKSCYEDMMTAHGDYIASYLTQAGLTA